jgi:hypothetical protein
VVADKQKIQILISHVDASRQDDKKKSLLKVKGKVTNNHDRPGMR